MPGLIRVNIGHPYLKLKDGVEQHLHYFVAWNLWNNKLIKPHECIH